MRINDIGYNFFHNADFKVERANGSGDFLFLLLKTPAIIMLDGEEIETEANSMILFNKGTPQIYRANGTHFLNDWIHFDVSESEIDRLYQLEIPFDNIVRLDDVNDLSVIIKYMCNENYSTNLYHNDSAMLYLKLFLFKLSEKLHTVESCHTGLYHDKLSLIRSKIYNLPYHKWTVGKLAGLAVMSVSHFEHMYKEIFGTSVLNDIIQSRLEYSKGLLSTTNIPIIKIAEISGYNSTSHFIRQFKSRENMTPTEYRKAFKK